ncbi:DUF455 family protein [bacterium]|nr:DUF455 family protein [bacterium]
MELSEFASIILFGDRWDDKIVASQDGFDDNQPLAALTRIPSFPGRPRNLSRIGRSDFPGVETLASDSARARLLHFFANHELLAMELMALTLLKFPDAEKSFRLGLARTIVEEQKHLKLYVERMRELGGDFGDLPISDYFWKALKDGSSPLEFVVHMSMTLEQANLDFSLFYQRAVAAIGDTQTAALLETVYREEIGHVKHGVTWFNRWRGQDEEDWDAYLRLLKPPMNPRRAKGPLFCAAARREAGLSERYISEMEVYSGSKGTPPSYWLYNPLCESEIVRGKPGFTGTKTVQNLCLDLETVPAFLARETDVVFVQELPRAGWLKSLQDAGIRLPEFRMLKRGANSFPERHIGGFEPWGWSPDAFELFKPASQKLIRVDSGNGIWSRSVLEKPDFSKTKLGELFSKTWSLRFYREWMEKHPEEKADSVGTIFSDWKSARAYLEEKLSRSEVTLAKAPWGTSGTMNKRVLNADELDGNLGKWIQNIIESQGSIILERWLDKVADFSVQIEVSKKPKVLGMRQFINGSRLEYRGTLLGPKLGGITPEQNRFLHTEKQGASPLSRWEAIAEAVGAALYAEGYEGNAGIDALLATDGEQLFFRPIVEINPRWTMGRVALELEKHVLQTTPAAWLFLPLDSLKETPQALAERHPVKKQTRSGQEWISEGIVFTNDPERAREVLTVLAVGTAAVGEFRSL